MRLSVTLAALLLATGAQAATITIQPGPISAASTALDLSSIASCGQSGAISTNVGTFTGSGRSASATSATSTCGALTSAQVRRGNDQFGRYREGIGSNDMDTLTWSLPQDTREAVFRLEDVGDIRGTDHFSISVGTDEARIAAPQANGAVNWVRVLFALTDPRDIVMTMFRPGDAGRDGWRVTDVSASPVPLPAPVLLLLAGIGGLAWVRRRAVA